VDDREARRRLVRIISKRKLREFWSVHDRTKEPLSAWHRLVEQVTWSGPADVRNTYRSADPVGDEFVVFDICNYRLIVRVDYTRSIVYIWDILTHVEYDRLDLKKIDEQIHRGKERRKGG
jgi:mRNA interferase HigB